LTFDDAQQTRSLADPINHLFTFALRARLAVLGPSPALAETFNGGRAVFIDGDTFALGSERVRILNIDAPETRGARCERELVLGLKAKERLAGLLRAGSVDVVRDGEDRYSRTPRPRVCGWPRCWVDPCP
jgi:endonuclease YncB( thermonuclease family)